MKRIYRTLPLFIAAFFLSCSATKDPEATAEQIKELDEIVSNKSIDFIARWARPLTTTSLNSVANAGLIAPGSTVNSIDMTTNPNYFKMVGDSVTAYFPYYGEIQLGGGGYPQNDNAIQFNGIPQNLRVDKDKKGYKIRFNIKDDTETYQVNAQLFPNKKGIFNINSSHRTPISYSGNFEELQEKSE